MLMIQTIRSLVRSQKGQGMVEYGLILALIAVVVLLAMTNIGTTLKAKLEAVAAAL